MLINHFYFDYSFSAKRSVFLAGVETPSVAPTPQPDFADKAAREKLYSDVRAQIANMDKKDPHYKTLRDFLGLADAADKKNIAVAAKGWSEKLYATLMKAGGKAEDVQARQTRQEIRDTRQEIADARRGRSNEAAKIVESGGVNNVPISEGEIAALTADADNITRSDRPEAPKVGTQYAVDSSWLRFDNPKALAEAIGMKAPNQIAHMNQLVALAQQRLTGETRAVGMSAANREIIAWAVRDTLHPERPPVLRLFLGHEKTA